MGDEGLAGEAEGRWSPSRSEERWDVTQTTEPLLQTLPQPLGTPHPMILALAEPQAILTGFKSQLQPKRLTRDLVSSSEKRSHNSIYSQGFCEL